MLCSFEPDVLRVKPPRCFCRFEDRCTPAWSLSDSQEGVNMEVHGSWSAAPLRVLDCDLTPQKTKYFTSSDSHHDISIKHFCSACIDILSGILSGISSDIVLTVFLAYLLTFYLAYLLSFFVAFYLEYLPTGG